MSAPHVLLARVIALACAAGLAAGCHSTPRAARPGPARAAPAAKPAPAPPAAAGVAWTVATWKVAVAQAAARAAAAPADGYENCDPYNGTLAFHVVVRDSMTGQGAAQYAVLAWQAGRSAGAEVWRPKYGLTEAVSIAGPYGRPGTYNVTVHAPGYRVWHAAGVRVARGEAPCSVGEPVTVSVRLQPAPG